MTVAWTMAILTIYIEKRIVTNDVESRLHLVPPNSDRFPATRRASTHSPTRACVNKRASEELPALFSWYFTRANGPLLQPFAHLLLIDFSQNAFRICINWVRETPLYF